MSDSVVIVAAKRTPIGSMNGQLLPLSSPQLASVAIKAALEQSGLKAEDITEALIGCVLPAALGQAPARQAVLGAGLLQSTATSTVKHATLRGQKLLIVQPLMADGRAPDGDPQLAIDAVGAGTGERVMITSDGKFVRELVKQENTPIRWSVIGIADA